MIAACLLCTPAASALAAKATAAKHADDAEITFIGYRGVAGGGGVLFVELSRSVSLDVSRAGPVIEYKLLGATVPLKNNRNPLLLRDFGSSALTAVLVPSGRGKTRAHRAEPKSVRLLVTMRGNVAPTYKMLDRGKGAALEISLPPAQ